MSRAYNDFYEQSHIPCNAPSQDAILESGNAQVNVDGRPVQGGMTVFVNGQPVCVNQQNSKAGGAQIFYLGGVGARYMARGSAAANNVNVVRALRANHL